MSTHLVPNPALTPASSASTLPPAPQPLNGRKVRPIIDGSTKGFLIFGVIATVILAIVTAVLTAHGIIPLGSWQFKLLVGIAGTIGSAQLLSVTGLAIHYFQEQKRRVEKARLEAAANHDSTPSPPPSNPPAPTTPSATTTTATTSATTTATSTTTTTTTTTATTTATSTTPTATAPPRPLLELSGRAWTTRLNQPKLDNGPAKFNFNLAEQGTPVAQNMSTIPLAQLPVFGKYNKSAPDFRPDALVMAARLPLQQAETFPKNLRNWLEPHAECYFLVFDNSDPSMQGRIRNFAMHPWALPEYDKQRPTTLPQNTGYDICTNQHEDGIVTDMLITMDGLQGIGVGGNTKTQIPTDGDARKNLLNLHGKPNKNPAFSPNSASFAIQKHAPVSSGYFAAKARGKTIAFHAIFLNTPEARDNFISAAGKGSVQAFLDDLDTQEFDCAQDISKTFTHPDELVS